MTRPGEDQAAGQPPEQAPPPDLAHSATAEQPVVAPEPGASATREQPTVADPAFLGTAQVPTQRLPEPEIPTQLPPIDAAELAGLYDGDDRASGIRRVSPLEDEASHLVARYLFPTERYRGEWKRHIIHLVGPVVTGVIATVVLGLLAGFIEATAPPYAPLLVSLSVLFWLATLAWVGWRFADWHFDRFILTNKRVMKVSGIITRKVAMMPLLRVTDMKYEQTPLGRILNYGTFVIESAGQDQALREVPHLPNPNELYLRVVEEMYEPEAVEARMKPEGDEDERNDA